MERVIFKKWFFERAILKMHFFEGEYFREKFGLRNF